MRSISKLALAAVLALSTNAFAQAKAKKPAETTKQESSRKKKESLHDQLSGTGYGLAGCGLGSIVFGAKPGIVQVVAATLNGIGGNQTFGITSATSNCDIPEMGQQAALFIEVNKEIVKKDAARGNGETIANLSEIMNCKDSALFGRKLQQNYEQLFDDENAYETTRRILNTIKSDAELSATCEHIG